MMDFVQAIMTAWLQASIVLGLAWGLCNCLTAFRRGQASGLMRGTMFLAGVLSVATFLPIPGYSLVFANYLAELCYANSANVPTVIAEDSGNTVAPEESSAPTHPIWRLQEFENIRSSSGNSGNSSWLGALVVVVVAVPLVLCLRQFLGLLSIVWLQRDSRRISGGRCDEVLRQLGGDGCERIEVRTSSRLSAAATTGWFRPVIFLPDEHTSWSDVELRAVFAHELAHIRKQDFLWRWLSGLYAACHYFNPLAHWLHRHMILEQEFAADRAASNAIGSRRAYARALSRLAMRADGDSRPVAIPGLLSMYSSTHLLRRLEMLRAKECSANRHHDGLYRWLSMFTLTAATLLALGLRVSADVQQGATDTASVESTVAPFDVGLLPFTNQGAFVIRPSVLIDTEQVGAYGAVVKRLWSEGCKEVGVPEIDLSKIEHIAGSLEIKVRHTGKTIEPGDEHEHENRLIIGSTLMLVRLHEKQDLVGRVKELFPDAQQVPGDPQQFVMKPIYALGPQKISLRVIDDQTLAVGLTEQGRAWIREHTELERRESNFSATWASIDKGVFTAIAEPSKVEWPENRKHWPKSVEELVSASQFASVGVSRDAHQFTMDLASRDVADSTIVEKAMVQIAANVKEFFAKKPNDDARFLGDWLANAKTEKIQGKTPTMRLTGPLVFVPNIASGQNDVAQPADRKASPNQQVRIATRVIELDQARLRKLRLELAVADESGKDSKKTPLEESEDFANWLNANQEASLPLLEKLRKQGLAKVLAAPTLTTVSGREAGFDDGTTRIQLTPEVTLEGDVLMRIDRGSSSNATNPWFKGVLLRPGKNYFFRTSSLIDTKLPVKLLQLRAELVEDSPKTASKPQTVR